jgi:hypothetical protein
MEVHGNIMHQPLYTRQNNPWYPLNRRLGGPKSQSECSEEKKNVLAMPGISLHHPAQSLVTILNELYSMVKMHISRLLMQIVHTINTEIKGDVWKCPVQPLCDEQS